MKQGTRYGITFTAWNSEPYEDMTWEQTVEAVRAIIEDEVRENEDHYCGTPTPTDAVITATVERECTRATDALSSGKPYAFADGSHMNLTEGATA